MCQRIKFLGVGILLRVAVVNTVNIGRLENNVRPYLGGTESRGSIGREEGVARSAAENYHPALLEVANRLVPDIRLGNLPHFNRGLNAGSNAQLLKRVRKCKGVDSGGEHTHMVGSCAVHFAA